MKDDTETNKLTLMTLYSLKFMKATGYELCKLFSKLIQKKPSHQQLYKSLRKNVDSGFIDFVLKANGGKPPKKIYALTEKGRNHIEKVMAGKDNPHLPSLAPLLHFQKDSDYLNQICALLGQHVSELNNKLLEHNATKSPMQVIHIKESIARAKCELEIVQIFRDNLVRTNQAA